MSWETWLVWLHHIRPQEILHVHNRADLEGRASSLFRTFGGIEDV